MATQLTPAAKPVSVYTNSTRADVPEPPQTNSYSQLGAALEKFAGGPGVAATHIAIENKNVEDRAFGSEAAQRAAMDKSIKNVNDAVKAKLIPEGMSPTAMLAYQANFAKLRAEQDALALRQEYYNSDLPNNPDPNAFPAWRQERLAQGVKSITQNEDGSPVFSNLELSKSGFHNTLTNALQGLETEHIAHRASENKKMFRTNASTLAVTQLESVLGTGTTLVPYYLRNQKAIADAATSPYYDNNSGQVVVGGMPGEDAAKDIRANLIQKALFEKDVTILDSARFINTNGGKTMADTAAWKTESLAAYRDIAGQIESEKRNRDHWLQEDAKGTPEERAKIGGDKYKFDASEQSKKQAISPYVDMMLGAKDQATSDLALEEINKIDASYGAHYSSLRNRLRTEKEELNARPVNPTLEIELRNLVAAHPGSAAVMTMVDNAAAHKNGQNPQIDIHAWQRLRTFGEKFAEDSHEHKALLGSDAFKAMEHDLRTTVKASAEPDFGVIGLNQSAANIELRQLAVATKKALGPNATDLQVVDAMQPGMANIAARHNGKVKEMMEQSKERRRGEEAYQKEVLRLAEPKVKAQTEQQVKLAKEETEIVKSMDKAGKKVTPESIAAEKSKRRIDTTNLKAAKGEMTLTPQEENLYAHHLRNLHGDGKVVNKDGSISTIRQSSFSDSKKTYNIPTIWDGKELDPEEAWTKAKGLGLDKFPSYDSVNKAESRYHAMHAYMERDTAAYQKK